MPDSSDKQSSNTNSKGDEKPAENKKLKAIGYIKAKAETSRSNLTSWTPQNQVKITEGLTNIWDSPVAETYSTHISGAVSSSDTIVNGVITDLSNAESQQRIDPGETFKPGSHPTEEKWPTEE